MKSAAQQPALSDHVVLITGASSGIGEAVARHFSEAGARVVLAARRTDKLEALQRTLPSASHVIALDVQDRGAVERAISSLPEGFRDLTVLVNNAGLALGLEPAQQAKLDDWETMVDTNIKGLMFVTRVVLAGMVERNRGHIINLGSVAGTYPYPGGNVYGATKAFVAQFSLNLRADLLGKQVRVTDIEPGIVETDFSRVRFRGDDEKARVTYQGFTPLSPDDVASSIVFCASQPLHVNINRLELMPVMQAFSPFAVSRG